MSTNVKTIGIIENPLGTSDEVQPTYDISSWLGTDAISTCAYAAYDENGNDWTNTVLNASKNSNTTTVMKPWLKGGGIDNKQYTVRLFPTTVNGEKKAFYIKFSVRDYK